MTGNWLIFSFALLLVASGVELACDDVKRTNDIGCFPHGEGARFAGKFPALVEEKALHKRATTSLTYIFDGSEPSASSRPTRDGVQGNGCTVFASGVFSFVQQSVFADSVGGITVVTTGTATNCNLFLTVHSAPFNPTNICSAYVWDSGFSTGIPPNYASLGMSFSATPNAPLYFVLLDTNSAGGRVCDGTITLTISGVADLAGSE